jgi:hypothetical protein
MDRIENQMPKFTVISHNNHNLVIEAESATLLQDSDDYVFKTGSEVVAVVPKSSNILAVVKQAADISDFYFSDHQDDDEFPHPEETDDVCLDCRFDELLESQKFFNAVADIVCEVLGIADADEPEDVEVAD